MFRKLASLLLAVLMIAGLAPVSVFAQSDSSAEQSVLQTEVPETGVSRMDAVKEEPNTKKTEKTAAVSASRGAGISYVDENGDAQSVTSYTLITSSTTELSSDVTGGWYVYQGEYSGTLPRMNVTNGDVNIIVADGASATTQGITVEPGHTLHIYGQTNNSGTLNITGGEYCAGIGGARYSAAGTIVICGGTLNVTGGRHGAAIGSSERSGGTVRITGGVINAKGGQYSAAIGGGDMGEGYENIFTLIEITGGTVSAKPGYEAAAIGGGCYGTCATIRLYGGSIKAERNGNASVGYSFRSNNKTCDIYIGWTRLTDCFDLVGYSSTGNLSINGSVHVEKTMMNAKTYDLIAAGSTTLPSGVKIVPPKLSGTGTEQDPYIIANNKGWEIFADNLKTPDVWNHFENRYVKFTNDVVTTTRVATTHANSFNGVILGNGKMLYFDNYGVAGVQSLAPFGYFDGNVEVRALNLVTNIHDAKDQYIAGLVAHCYGNVTISGCTVRGTLSTNSKFAGGFISESIGAVTIIGCKSSVIIKSSVDGDGTHAGFIAVQRNMSGSSINIYGCVFNGSFISTNTDHPTSCCGGFLGWRTSNRTARVYDSIFAPEDISTIDPTGCENIGRNGLTDLNRNVRTKNFENGSSTPQGLNWHCIIAGENVNIDYGTPVENGVYASGITAYSRGLLYNDGQTTVYYADPNETHTLTLTAVEYSGYLPDVFSADTCTLTHGTGSSYSLRPPYNSDVTITVTYAPDPAHFSVNAAGTEYTIHSSVGWEVFCDCLEKDEYNRFIGKTVKLDANISASRMAGSDGHEFCGIFDGNGCTLEFNPATAFEADYSAPFHYVGSSAVNTANKPAAILNLYMKGNNYSSGIGTAGIIGVASGTVNVTNCRAGIGIHSSNKASGNDSGIVGKQADGTLTITGCIYDGSFWTFSNTANYNCGGFVGFRENGVTRIYNSLFAPWECNFVSEDCATFIRGANSSCVIENSYYTKAFSTAQGKQARTIGKSNGVTLNFGEPLAGGVYSVSGITAYEHVLLYNRNYYSGEGDDVALTITGSLTPNTGYHVEFTADAGTLTAAGGSAYTLTMPDENVTVKESLVLNTYTVLWKNGDDVLEKDENVGHGAAPTYDGEEPVKAEDDQYTYVFEGWTPEIQNVTEDVTYTAIFTAVLKTPREAISGDGEVNITDVTALLNHLALSDEYDSRFDLNNDGSVNIGDVTHLLNVLAGY